MAVRIRLKKLGRAHRPFFRVCAMDSRSPRDGRVIEELGIYDPMVPESDARAILQGDRIDYWLGVGAQPTRKVGVLIKKYGKDGTHLEAQAEAIGRLSGRRAAAIESAKAAAAAVEMPKVEEPKPAEEAPPAEETTAEATAESAAKESTSGEESAATAEATAESAAKESSSGEESAATAEATTESAAKESTSSEESAATAEATVDTTAAEATE